MVTQGGRRAPAALEQIVGRRPRGRGQGLVEFAFIVPLFTLILFGMLEFGFAFSHNLTLEYATREGARIGSSVANGTTGTPCVATGTAISVDQAIVAAVQRVLNSPGSPVDITQVSAITIYKADPTTGLQDGANPNKFNVWIPGSTTLSTGEILQFKPDAARQGWNACTRKNTNKVGSPPDSIGVSLTYSYKLESPLGVILGWGTGASIPMTDRTVMTLNPPNMAN